MRDKIQDLEQEIMRVTRVLDGFTYQTEHYKKLDEYRIELEEQYHVLTRGSRSRGEGYELPSPAE